MPWSGMLERGFPRLDTELLGQGLRRWRLRWIVRQLHQRILCWRA